MIEGTTIASILFTGSAVLCVIICYGFWQLLNIAPNITETKQSRYRKMLLSKSTGISVFVAIGLFSVVVYVLYGFTPSYWPVLLAALLLCVISYFDAVKRMPLWLVSGLQFIMILPLTDWVLGSDVLLYGVLPEWTLYIIFAFLWLWILHLAIYMDGVDGLLVSHSIVTFIGFTLIAVMHVKDLSLFYASASLTGALCAFLLFNWYPAKLKLGRAGSVPIGLFIGWMSLELIKNGLVISTALLLLYFLVDGSYTLMQKIMRPSAKVGVFKKGHFYRIAVEHSGKSVNKVVTTILAVHISLVALAVISPSFSELQGLCLIAGMGLVVWLLYWLQGKNDVTA